MLIGGRELSPGLFVHLVGGAECVSHLMTVFLLEAH